MGNKILYLYFSLALLYTSKVFSLPIWDSVKNHKHDINHSETHVKKYLSRKTTSTEKLSLTPLDNSPRNRPVDIDITHYSLKLHVDPRNGEIKGRATLTFKSKTKNRDKIILDAYDMQIQNIFDNSNTELPFSNDGEVITITLPTKLIQNQSYAVTIHYSAKRAQSFFITTAGPANPNRMTTGYTYTQPEGSRKWFPCIDRPSDKALMDIDLHIPKEFNGLSNGRLISLKQNAVENIYSYTMDKPISPYLVSIIIGNFQLNYLGQFREKPLTLWAPPQINHHALFETRNTLKMMESFTQFTATEYPFSSYTQSVAQAWGTSMEHQSATTMGGWRIAGDGSGEGVVAHELAHQWFGDWVTCERWTELWLNEGFATYMPYVFFSKSGQHNSALSYEDYWRDGYFAEAKKKVRALSGTAINIDNIFDSHSYEKGALIIKMLRELVTTTMSDKNAFSWVLNYYFKQRGGKTVRNTDLQEALEKTTNISWQLFFDQWIRSPGHPILKVKYKNDINNQIIINIEQSQTLDSKKSSWPTFSFPLEIELIGSNKKSKTKQVNIYNTNHEFRFHPGFAVKAINIDPRWVIPAEFTISQNQDQWLEIMRHSIHEKSRLYAMRNILTINSLAKKEFISLLKNETSLYLVVDALDKMTNNTKNLQAITEILKILKSKEKTWDRIVRGGYASAEAWTISKQTEKITKNDEKKWQNDYLNSAFTSERRAALNKLKIASLERAHVFAINRLSESNWVTKDRGYIIDLLTKNPAPSSHAFIVSMLQTGSYYWVKRVIRNLISSKYQHEELVPMLIKLAKTHRYMKARVAAIELLSIQKLQKTKVCKALEQLSKKNTTNQAKWFEYVKKRALKTKNKLCS